MNFSALGNHIKASFELSRQRAKDNSDASALKSYAQALRGAINVINYILSHAEAVEMKNGDQKTLQDLKNQYTMLATIIDNVLRDIKDNPVGGDNSKRKATPESIETMVAKAKETNIYKLTAPVTNIVEKYNQQILFPKYKGYD